MTNLGSQKLHIWPKVTEIGSIIGHRIDYNGVGALRGQRRIPCKNLPKYPRASCALVPSTSTRTNTSESARRLTFNLSSYHVWYDVHVQVAFRLVACFRVRFNSLPPHHPNATLYYLNAWSRLFFLRQPLGIYKIILCITICVRFFTPNAKVTHLLNDPTVHYRWYCSFSSWNIDSRFCA